VPLPTTKFLPFEIDMDTSMMIKIPPGSNNSNAKARSTSHRFHTKVSFVLTVATIVLLVILSALFGGNYHDNTTTSDSFRSSTSSRWLEDNNNNANNDDNSNNNNNDNGDYSRFSCRYIYDQVPDPGKAQCQFARTCNGGDGVWGSWVFCSPLGMSVWLLFLLLSPVMIVWMVTLFRLLGSTAEEFFSPSLEMFSLKLGLPPRFAGVTLLALGNGAADVSATMSAIASDEANGYKLSLGALTGAAMLVGCVVSGIVILVADGVTCRGALVRDVTALAVTVAIVWTNLSSGVITPGIITLFLSLYVFFVLIVLVADIYHRAVVLPRIAAVEAAIAAAEGSTLDGAAPAVGVASPPNAFMRFVTAFSNYDNLCERDTTVSTEIPDASSGDSVGNNQHATIDGLDMPQPRLAGSGSATVDEPIRLHGQHGILHGDGQVPLSSVDSTPAPTHPASSHPAPSQSPEDGGAGGGAYTLVEDHMDQICVGGGSPGIQSHNWKGAWEDGKQEVKSALDTLWEDIAFNGDLKAYEKFLLVCEFPFTLLRKVCLADPARIFASILILSHLPALCLHRRRSPFLAKDTTTEGLLPCQWPCLLFGFGSTC
jgi:Sodium/calcium exchanger protein